MSDGQSGCFAWCISFKKSCNERWARFRNRLRRRFYARRGMTLDPETLLNETGTTDMVVGKISCKSNKIMPQNLSPKDGVTKDDAVITDNTIVTEEDKLGLWSTEERKFINDKVDFVYDLVEEYVMYIINKAVDSLRQEVHHNTHTAILKPADDNISLSSSVISQIADIAVTESLTNIVLETDNNQSAIRGVKTVKELKEAFGITGSDVIDDGLPPVSE